MAYRAMWDDMQAAWKASGGDPRKYSEEFNKLRERGAINSSTDWKQIFNLMQEDPVYKFNTQDFYNKLDLPNAISNVNRDISRLPTYSGGMMDESQKRALEANRGLQQRSNEFSANRMQAAAQNANQEFMNQRDINTRLAAINKAAENISDIEARQKFRNDAIASLINLGAGVAGTIIGSGNPMIGGMVSNISSQVLGGLTGHQGANFGGLFSGIGGMTNAQQMQNQSAYNQQASGFNAAVNAPNKPVIRPMSSYAQPPPQQQPVAAQDPWMNPYRLVGRKTNQDIFGDY